MCIMQSARWMGTMLLLFIISSCQLVGGDYESPVEGRWSLKRYNPPYEREYSFFPDGGYETFGYSLDPDTGERIELIFASVGSYRYSNEWIQFSIAWRTPPNKRLPMDALNNLNEYLVRPEYGFGGQQNYFVSESDLILEYVCGPNANCPGPQLFKRMGEPIRRTK